MKTQLMMTAVALALAACGSSADKSGGNGTEAAAGDGGGAGATAGGGGGAAAQGGGGGGEAAGVSLQPGEWEMKMEVVSVAAPGLPAGMTDSMKQAASRTDRTCMTPEEAKAPKGDLFAGDNSRGCTSEGFKWEGGRIQGRTTCPGQPGGAGKTVMKMDGRYSPQSIDMTMKSETDLMGKAMTMEMRVSGKRVGECSAATKEG